MLSHKTTELDNTIHIILSRKTTEVDKKALKEEAKEEPEFQKQSPIDHLSFLSVTLPKY